MRRNLTCRLPKCQRWSGEWGHVICKVVYESMSKWRNICHEAHDAPASSNMRSLAA